MSDRHHLLNERISKCSQELGEVMKFLEIVAMHAGLDGADSTVEARGIGIAYWVRGRRFCRFDPKFHSRAPHIFAFVADARVLDLARAGATGKQRGWVKIENLRGAVQLVPIILQAYSSVGLQGRGSHLTAGASKTGRDA
jgi:hypothetical protein